MSLPSRRLCRNERREMLRFFCTQILHLLDEEEQPITANQTSEAKPVIAEETLTEEEILLLEEAEAEAVEELEGQTDMDSVSTKKKRRPSKSQLSDTPTKRSSPDRELEDEEVDDLLALVDEMKL